MKTFGTYLALALAILSCGAGAPSGGFDPGFDEDGEYRCFEPDAEYTATYYLIDGVGECADTIELPNVTTDSDGFANEPSANESLARLENGSALLSNCAIDSAPDAACLPRGATRCNVASPDGNAWQAYITSGASLRTYVGSGLAAGDTIVSDCRYTLSAERIEG